MSSSPYTDLDFERRHPEGEFQNRHSKRSPFEIDRARIVHSTAFRVLQGKTQVFSAGRSVQYRTRLTHSIEVAQLARGLCRETLSDFSPDEDLVEAICLAHDIGHPPFGHAGERILNEIMRPEGGFDANAQNLRVVDSLESKHVAGGLNLSRATLDGLIKIGQNGPRVYEADAALLGWVKLGHKGSSVEAQLSNWADLAAYCVADIEDASRLGLLNPNNIKVAAQKVLQTLRSTDDITDGESGELYNLADAIPYSADFSSDVAASRDLKEWTSSTLHFRLMSGCEIREVDLQSDSVRYRHEFTVPNKNKRVARFLRGISEVLVYRNSEALSAEETLRDHMRELFDKLRDNVPPNLTKSVSRTVCDQIASMSDRDFWDLLNSKSKCDYSNNPI